MAFLPCITLIHALLILKCYGCYTAYRRSKYKLLRREWAINRLQPPVYKDTCHIAASYAVGELSTLCTASVSDVRINKPYFLSILFYLLIVRRLSTITICW